MTPACAHIIDDDEAIRDALRWLFKTREVACETWPGAEDFLAAVEPDWRGCIVLDIRMDGMSGFDVARYLRDALQVPFVFLSAFSDEATLAQIRALGALASLVKPLDIAQIIPAVEQALVEVRRRREMHEGRDAPATPAAVPPEPATPVAPVSAPDPLDDMVAIAVGIVMHRFSLDRSAALQRLERLARQEGRPLPQSCRAMVEALERLALAGGI